MRMMQNMCKKYTALRRLVGGPSVLGFLLGLQSSNDPFPGTASRAAVLGIDHR